MRPAEQRCQAEVVLASIGLDARLHPRAAIVPRGEQVELRITHRVLGDARLGLGAAGAPFGVDDLDVGAGPAR
jgi:hypothetical protein